MEDENRLREIDQQVIAALQPDDAVVRRVLSVGLQEQREPREPGRRVSTAAAIAVGAVAIIAAVTAVILYWRGSVVPPAPPRADLTITGTGASIVVERADGQRWFFGPPPEASATGSSYLIVVPNQGELR